MKILEFTFEGPSKWYGGGICVGQSMVSLTCDNDVDYIGPDYDENQYPQIKVGKKYILNDDNGVVKKTINLFRGVTIKFYQNWKRTIQQIDTTNYDIVFVDFSYNDFIIDWAHKHNLKTVVRVHNIEADMVDSVVNGKVHDKYWIKNIINGNIIKKREKRVMQSCDQLLFLTEEDKIRASKLYGPEIIEKSTVIPICMYGNNKPYCDLDLKKPYILATGSLYYGPNSEGIKWLLRNVWPAMKNTEVCKDYSLVIAGRNPDDEMKKLVGESERCILIDSPENIYPYYQNADLYVAPIFYGAGMKVKVAEALSYGLMVVGSHHALIGYNESKTCCVEANTATEFQAAIKHCLETKIPKEQCITEFENYYSIQRSINSYDEIIKYLRK